MTNSLTDRNKQDIMEYVLYYSPYNILQCYLLAGCGQQKSLKGITRYNISEKARLDIEREDINFIRLK